MARPDGIVSGRGRRMARRSIIGKRKSAHGKSNAAGGEINRSRPQTPARAIFAQAHDPGRGARGIGQAAGGEKQQGRLPFAAQRQLKFGLESEQGEHIDVRHGAVDFFHPGPAQQAAQFSGNEAKNVGVHETT